VVIAFGKSFSDNQFALFFIATQAINTTTTSIFLLFLLLMSKKIYTKDCLDPKLLSQPADVGWLSPEELTALKETDGYDPKRHREDGSIVGFRTQDINKHIKEILNYLNLLDPDLKTIVDAELLKGNFVTGTGIDYPQKGSINVTLSQHFTDEYESSKVKFSLCNDPHYWYADYSTHTKPEHILIC
jgi:hypothetical protein